ncbi:family 18 glycosyl hydrolase [Cercophora scortea]|uniref:chitinase n=1 Tax=Cercophora scortea TaxID=314031 RepID=A0AAE0IW53_9PEZI|nr:family 18 glycosyl hydrolase [Cercophora scortea]
MRLPLVHHSVQAYAAAFLAMAGLGFVTALESNERQHGNSSVATSQLLGRALPAGTCDATTSCDPGGGLKACCNGKSFFCGYGAEYCDASVCIHDCDAKAECGAGADPSALRCPLGVCCSKFGFCGTTPDFCDAATNCVLDCPQPGSTKHSTSNVQETVIGYAQSWSLITRGCRQRDLAFFQEIRDSLTHLNVAFGYIYPDSFEVYPIPGSSIVSDQELTNIKQLAPGLSVWLSIGGWSFSDNDTDTQAVWGDLASTAAKRAKFIQNLSKFMLQWGFDGIDLDWEYPAAPDGRGHKEDTANFVLLVSDMRSYFSSLGHGWGISFAAPASYWYLRWFNMREMIKYVDWVNLMTYDLHGLWDKDSRNIGPYIYPHTNLTEIKDALNLLWRAEVPANKVNLGLGFYGRSCRLKNKNCAVPGCEFDTEDGPVAGSCSGTSGCMSYQDIAYKIGETGAKIHTDTKDAVAYMKYDDDQWISFNTQETLKLKVDFANSQGLRDAVLSDGTTKGGLGRFKERNGVGNDGGTWDKSVPLSCQWSECGRGCGAGQQKVTSVLCSNSQRKDLCCPFNNAPDPAACKWTADPGYVLGCSNPTKCESGYINVAQSQYFVSDDNKDHACSFGEASYCCKAVMTGGSCEWSETCSELDGVSPPSDACPASDTFVTYKTGNGCRGSTKSGRAYCCAQSVPANACRWACDIVVPMCNNDEIDMGLFNGGGGNDNRCIHYGGPGEFSQDSETDPRLCCNRKAMTITYKTLPIPLGNLFPSNMLGSGSGDNSNKFDVEIDSSKGKGTDPDDNAFGWYIMSGPPDQISTLDRRDGSHWEVYDCDEEHHEGRQQAKLVCIDESETSNCNDIYEGGVPLTVIKMPPHCGPGKYAVAVDLQPLYADDDNDDMDGNSTDSRYRDILPIHIARRNLKNPRVHVLTFDYDFSPIQGRTSSQILFRTDYSDDSGYWDTVVAASSKKRGMTKRDRHSELWDAHGGSWKSYLDHTWREERLAYPHGHHKRDELHTRWFSLSVANWVNRMSEVSYQKDVIHHVINKQLEWKLIDQSLTCPRVNAHSRLTAELNINIDTSAQLSLIGYLNNLQSFEQSNLLFRNYGSIEAALIFDARA